MKDLNESQNIECVNTKNWPLDLYCDLILKVYHRNIRSEGPKILAQLDKVCETEGEAHPSLFEVKELFEVSLMDLEHHLQKEERILFPYIYTLCDAQMNGGTFPIFHCGSIANPIEVMKIEHSAEVVRYDHIDTLTGGYAAPANVSEDYRNMMSNLKEFNKSLREHIHLENDIVFPRAIELYDELESQNY